MKNGVVLKIFCCLTQKGSSVAHSPYDISYNYNTVGRSIASISGLSKYGASVRSISYRPPYRTIYYTYFVSLPKVWLSFLAITVLLKLLQADLITSEERERAKYLSDVVELQRRKSLEVMNQTALILKANECLNECRLLSGEQMYNIMHVFCCVVYGIYVYM